MAVIFVEEKTKQRLKIVMTIGIVLILVGLYLMFTNGTFRTQIYGGYLSQEQMVKKLEKKYGEKFEWVSVVKGSENDYVFQNKEDKFQFKVNTCMYQPFGIPVLSYAKMNDNYAAQKYEEEFTKFLDEMQIKYTVTNTDRDKMGCESYGNGKIYTIEFNQQNLEEIANEISQFILSRKEEDPYTKAKCGVLYLKGPASSYKYEELCNDGKKKKYKSDEVFSEENLLKQMWKAYGR